MKKNIEKQNLSNLDLLVEDINKNIYNGDLIEIFEVTYSYKKSGENNFNITLFSDFLRLDIEKIDLNNKNKILDLKTKTEQKIIKKQELIKKYITEIKNIEKSGEEEEIISELLSGSLDYSLKILEVTKLGLVFELEKAGVKNNLSLEQKQVIIDKIKNLEAEVFGSEIKDNPEEVILAYEFLRDKFEKNKKNFFKKQEEKYLEYLRKAEEYLPENYSYSPKKNEENKENDINTEFLNKKIPREKYSQILQDVFDLLKLDIEVKIEERGSIYDGEHHLGIPKNDKYKFLTIKRILELISHEIEAHTVNLRNNQKLIGYFRSAANLEKEEGLAIVMENLLNGKKIEEIGIPGHFPKVFMGEILIGRELKEFFDLNNIIDPDTGHAGRFLRLKRNYDLDLPGVQHKDTSYGRGALKTVELLQKIKSGEEKNIEVRDLFLAKVGFKDIQKAKKLMQLKGFKYNDLTMPIFIGELVKYLFEIEDNNKNSRNKKNISRTDFIRYLKEKYNFINFDEIDIPVVSFLEKRKIVNILKTIQNSI